MVGPHAQDVVGALLPNLACNRLLATHGVQGHDAALQAQHAQQLREGRDLVGPAVHRGLGQHQAVGLGPGTDQVQGLQAPAPIVGAAHALAVDGHDLAPGQGEGRLHPVPEAFLEAGRVQPRADPAQGVVRGNAVRQGQEGAQPLLVEPAEEGNGHEAVRPADEPARTEPGCPSGGAVWCGQHGNLPECPWSRPGTGTSGCSRGSLRRLNPEPTIVATQPPTPPAHPI